MLLRHLVNLFNCHYLPGCLCCHLRPLSVRGSFATNMRKMFSYSSFYGRYYHHSHLPWTKVLRCLRSQDKSRRGCIRHRPDATWWTRDLVLLQRSSMISPDSDIRISFVSVPKICQFKFCQLELQTSRERCFTFKSLWAFMNKVSSGGDRGTNYCIYRATCLMWSCLFISSSRMMASHFQSVLIQGSSQVDNDEKLYLDSLLGGLHTRS